MSDLGCLEAVLAGGLIGQSATGCTANKWSWARGFLGFTAPDQDQALGDENKRDGCTDRGDVAPDLTSRISRFRAGCLAKAFAS